jgi:hypothetical protein
MLLLAAGCGEAPEQNMTAEEIGAQLAGMRIEPGLWELTSEVVDVTAPNLPREVRSRMIGPRSRLRHCITPEQAAHPSGNFLAGRDQHNCAYRGFTVEGGRVRGTMFCPDATASMNGRYAPNAYDMSMEMQSPMPGGATMTLQLRARGRRLGSCEQAEGADR